MPLDSPPFELPPPKFQHRYRKHVVLFLLTLFTATFRELFEYILAFRPDLIPRHVEVVGGFGAFLRLGLWYSLPMLTILGAHEFGHYWYCRRHNVDATLPYFLPAPMPLTGTLGAVIRIKERFQTRAALFDIAIAGPIAGFVMLLPFLYFGVKYSQVAVIPENYQGLYFGEPLLFRIVAYARFGTLPEGSDIFLHPLGMAAWFGMLATALNLLPFGQLDGGHISYAVLGRRAWVISLVTLVTTLVLTVFSASWFLTAVIMLAMALFLGLRHPDVIDDRPLDARRRMVAVLAIIMLILCFTPVPIQLVGT